MVGLCGLHCRLRRHRRRTRAILVVNPHRVANTLSLAVKLSLHLLEKVRKRKT